MKQQQANQQQGAKNMKTIYFAVVAVLVAVLVTGCAQQPTGEVLEQAQEYQAPANWQIYSDEQLQFRYPADWFVIATENETGSLNYADYQASVADTDKELVLGGAAPEDYYLGEVTEHRINTEKYAENYTVFKVAFYERQALDWQQFFSQFYPDVVEFKPYQVEEKPSLDAVVATQLTGLLPGKINLFVKEGSRFYHFSLYYSQDREREAKQNFNDFVLNFNF